MDLKTLQVAARNVVKRAAYAVRRPTSSTQRVDSIGLVEAETLVGLSGATPKLIIGPEHVTDCRAGFVADPFAIRQGDRWYVFYEVWNEGTLKGEIACSSSVDLAAWRYEGLVMRPMCHLSYPQVFEDQGRIYMIPESHQLGRVSLYVAESFPQKWKKVADLIHGDFSDPSVTFWEGRWWMLASPTKWPTFSNDETQLFWAERLEGPWHAHPANPVVQGDGTAARGGGRIVQDGGKLFRFAQICYPQYGVGVRLFQIDRLTEQEFQQTPLAPDPFLSGSGSGWNAHGMHHLDAQPNGEGWIGFVDGWVDKAKLP